MRFLAVTGDRDAKFEDWEHICNDVFNVMVDDRPLIMYHGACEGIDLICAEIAESPYYRHRIIPVPYPALWNVYGRGAGPVRNGAMIKTLLIHKEYGHEIAVVGFHNNIGSSKGTKSMITLSHQASIPVQLYNLAGVDYLKESGLVN